MFSVNMSTIGWLSMKGIDEYSPEFDFSRYLFLATYRKGFINFHFTFHFFSHTSRSGDQILPVLFSQLDVSSKMPSGPYQ